MKIGDVVQWTGAREGTWTGSGKAEIIAFDPARKYFGSHGTGQDTPGPAIKLKLLDATRAYDDVWVEQSDLAPWIEDAETKATLAAIQAQAAAGAE